MRNYEKHLRSLIRESLLKEWDIMHALMMSPESTLQGIYQFFRDDVFGPTQQERLARTGDDDIIDKYQTFMGTIHLMPEYKLVWENYKKAQRSHSSMDKDFDRARDIRHPVGRAFNKIKSRLMMKLDELEETLSPENRDIWKPSVDQSRKEFEKIFGDWYVGKITTGRVLGMLDPRGIVESRKRGRKISEGGEMFWGKDAVLMHLSRASNVIETALMDMEDVGCPGHSFAHTHLEEALEELEKTGDAGDAGDIYDGIIKILHGAQTAVRNCREIDKDSAYRIALDIDAVEKDIVDWAHSPNSGIEF